MTSASTCATCSRNASTATAGDELTTEVDRLRAKIGERRREGSIDPGYARQLDAAAAGLAAART
ncbi:hypothetical protein EV384_6674 [Micromonospora kangleipakensis]|uniref:Uncharacterized protein n=1 Tax=Micromonospora kangleipakensis TaxID=1077942 RepID=A0A4Q8BIM9_9ACTN|nr:hypothetical protein [Micromonospora kangleipakensis]RZU77930.1 hypothetical protein EV384_6674 [Micromonospora kangleipakensis]